jgi:NAD(P)-dependent dehydrogenase (short-subunit alcohol dehydrogenase family)
MDSFKESMRDKVVVVTGGGSGLGAAICTLLTQNDAVAVVADVDRARAAKVAEQLGERAMPLQLDVSSERSIRDGLAQIADRRGRIDALINNAGVDVTLSIEDLSVDDWERVMRTNLHGPFLTTKYALPYLRKANGGHIVNIASTAARRAWPNASAYHASKWGLLGLSHAMHAELRPQNIKVTAVIAGGMRTPFLLERFPDIDTGTLQDPSAVARAVLFALSSPAESVIPEMMVLPMRETSWP